MLPYADKSHPSRSAKAIGAGEKTGFDRSIRERDVAHGDPTVVTICPRAVRHRQSTSSKGQCV